MFEHRSQPLLPWPAFLKRLARSGGVAWAMIAASLLAGMVGYHALQDLNWTDAFLNAAMILGGMGPVNTPTNDAAKIFAGVYALYSGLIILFAASVMLAPVLHRLLHRFHLEGDAAAKDDD